MPTLVTTTPGSIVGSSSGSRYGRLTSGFGAYFGSWRIGDEFTFHFDGVVSNNTQLRLEFSNGASSGLLGLQFVIVNASSDQVNVSSLGGTTAQLFSGSFGGASGVGAAQHIVSDLTFSILNGGTAATVSGSISDDLGNRWNGPSATINLGTAPASLFAAMNLNTGGGVSGINGLSWTLTPVPEPGTAVLFAGLGLAALAFRRRLRRNS